MIGRPAGPTVAPIGCDAALASVAGAGVVDAAGVVLALLVEADALEPLELEELPELGVVLVEVVDPLVDEPDGGDGVEVEPLAVAPLAASEIPAKVTSVRCAIAFS